MVDCAGLLIAALEIGGRLKYFWWKLRNLEAVGLFGQECFDVFTPNQPMIGRDVPHEASGSFGWLELGAIDQVQGNR